MRLRVLLVSLATLAAGVVVAPAPASAAASTSASAAASGQAGDRSGRIRTPGSLTGYGFDTCVTPSHRVMDRWWRTSPFTAVGIYISGAGRACPARSQPHLSPRWVQRQHDRGWRILPIHVGRQAPCFQAGDPTPTKPRMSHHRKVARHQGANAADASIKQARHFGIGRGSVLYLDIEWYDRGRHTCNRAVLSFVHGWTHRLHDRHFRSGLYSSGSAAIQALDGARHRHPKRFDWPNQMWGACSDCRPVGDLRPYLSRDYWRGSSRLHQYALNVRGSYGGVRYQIDRNRVDVGRGSRPKRPNATCGMPLQWRQFPTLSRGDKGERVVAARCLLRRQDFLHAKGGGDHFRGGVVRAVKRLQDKRGLRVTGVLNGRTWVSLLAAGGDPLIKIGSDSRAVWRLQRAMVAAGHRTPIRGVFGQRTMRAVKAWQRATGRPQTGVVNGRQWRALRRGVVN